MASPLSMRSKTEDCARQDGFAARGDTAWKESKTDQSPMDRVIGYFFRQ